MTVTQSSQPGGVTAVPRANAAGTIDAPPEPAYGGWGIGAAFFSHLIEDAVNTQLVADWGFTVGDVLGVGAYGSIGAGAFFGGDGTDRAVSLAANGGLSVTGHDGTDSWVMINEATDSQPRFSGFADGSLHWGDGTAAPDTILQRTVGFPALLVNDPNGNGVYVAKTTDASGDNSWIGPGAADFHAGTDDVEIIPNQQAAVKIDRAGAGLFLKSPDGLTTKIVTIDNAGALTLV